MTKLEKAALAGILAVATIVRLWRFPSYFPYFWDEAKYLAEIEKIIPLFGVNVGAFSFLKLGQAIIGESFYPQVVTSVFGVLTVLGCYLLGRRMLHEQRESQRLGLLMAGQAALMPYFISYSRHALATGFALCAFVYALYFYVLRVKDSRLSGPTGRWVELRHSAQSAGMLAMVPTCSFNLLLPTLVLFIALEILVWHGRSAKRRRHRSQLTIAASVASEAALFLILPVFFVFVSGYTGWWTRAIALSEFHGAIRTMRLALHPLYPLHVWYFCGPLVALCALGGMALLLFRSRLRDKLSIHPEVNLILLFGFVVYVLFFGLFSHLQSARLYALSLPFLVYASSIFMLRLRPLLPRFGRIIPWIVTLGLFLSLGWKSVNYLSKTSQLGEASDVMMQHILTDQIILANSKDPIGYCTWTSKYHKRVPYNVISFLSLSEWKFDRRTPPMLVIEDGVDLVSTVASYDKRDFLSSIDILQARFQAIRGLADRARLIFAAAEDFPTSPYFYLEDVYSWRSYSYYRRLMPFARDSIYVYVMDPAQFDSAP